jgi:hypothetical protein
VIGDLGQGQVCAPGVGRSPGGRRPRHERDTEASQESRPPWRTREWSGDAACVRACVCVCVCVCARAQAALCACACTRTWCRTCDMGCMLAVCFVTPAVAGARMCGAAAPYNRNILGVRQAPHAPRRVRRLAGRTRAPELALVLLSIGPTNTCPKTTSIGFTLSGILWKLGWGGPNPLSLAWRQAAACRRPARARGCSHPPP